MKQVIIIGIIILCIIKNTTGIHLRNDSIEQRKKKNGVNKLEALKQTQNYADFMNNLREGLKNADFKDALVDSLNAEKEKCNLSNPQNGNVDLSNINSPWDSKRLEKLGLINKLVSIKVKDLQPTQNEIGLQNSLDFALTQDDATQYFSEKPIMIAGPILTYKGTHVLDGHHRWSQLYMLNPEAEILAFNIEEKEGVDPEGMLKLLQKAIGAYFGSLPQASSDGTINVFSDKTKIDDYLNCRFRKNKADSSMCSSVDIPKSTEGKEGNEKKCIECENNKHKFAQDSFIDSYIKENKLTIKTNDSKRDIVKEHIRNNINLFVEEMKKKNENLKSNPNRTDMPQTDGPKNLKIEQIKDPSDIIKDNGKIYTLPAILRRLMKIRPFVKDTPATESNNKN